MHFIILKKLLNISYMMSLILFLGSLMLIFLYFMILSLLLRLILYLLLLNSLVHKKLKFLSLLVFSLLFSLRISLISCINFLILNHLIVSIWILFYVTEFAAVNDVEDSFDSTDVYYLLLLLSLLLLIIFTTSQYV